jgi:hypothetical protein
LGTLWLKIEQFWAFEEISIFSNGGHLRYSGFRGTVVLSTSEKIAYMYTFKIMFDTSVIQ